MDSKLENQLLDLVSIESQLAGLKKTQKELEERKAEISDELLNYFETVDTKPIETEDLKISYVKPSVRYSIDKEGLQEKYPQIAEEFTKETQVKASIRIKLRENN